MSVQTMWVLYHQLIPNIILISASSLNLLWPIGILVFSSKTLAIFSPHAHSNCSFSTGKRRYGHPALNGVLPQPWLPLKKGQSIQNGPPSAPPASEVDTTPAVVLTLRKRYSISARTKPADAAPAPGAPPQENASDTPENPWQDAVSPTSERHRASHLHHRLSFDAASGVIMLPDDGDWLEDESDSDEDYGVVRTQPAPGLQETAGATAAPQGQVAQSPPTSVSKRYATYYHHPERRKRP